MVTRASAPRPRTLEIEVKRQHHLHRGTRLQSRRPDCHGDPTRFSGRRRHQLGHPPAADILERSRDANQDLLLAAPVMSVAERCSWSAAPGPRLQRLHAVGRDPPRPPAGCARRLLRTETVAGSCLRRRTQSVFDPRHRVHRRIAAREKYASRSIRDEAAPAGGLDESLFTGQSSSRPVGGED